MAVGRPWANRDFIIRQRANGYIGLVNWVESGGTLQNIVLLEIDVTSFVAHVDAFRIPWAAGPYTVTLLNNVTNYIYAEFTATFDGGGHLDGISLQAINAYNAAQSFVAPRYGVLLGTVETAAGVGLTDTIEETNRGVPATRFQDIATAMYSVGPKGCDYEYLERAIADSPDGSTLVCYPGANYIITNNITLTKSLTILSYDMLDPRAILEVPDFIPVPEITVTAGFAGTMITLGAAGKLYLGGLSFRYDDNSHIIASNATSYLNADRCRFRRDDAGPPPAQPILQVSAGEMHLQQCKIVGDNVHGLRCVGTGNLFLHECYMSLTTAGEGIQVAGGLAKINFTEILTTDESVLQDTAASTFFAIHSYLDASTASPFAQNHAGAVAYFYETFLEAAGANAPITNTLGTINWGNGSSCVGNNVANVITGTLNQRAPANEFETARIADITRDVFYNVGPNPDSIGDYPGDGLAAGVPGGVTRVAGYVPWDFGTLVDAVLVVVPDHTDATFAAINDVDHGAVGEAYNVHSSGPSAIVFNATANQIAEIDISGDFAVLAAGDYFGVKFTNNEPAQTLTVLGVRLRYSK